MPHIAKRRPLRRVSVLFAAVALALSGTSPAQATAPSAAAAEGVRTAMTWTVLGQQGGYVHAGSDTQTNAYAGDTAIDQYLPALCVLVDGQALPAGITPNATNGWARGSVRTTAAVRGDALSSQAAGDTLCSGVFGTGWRLAEFHDGKYGTDLTASAGWSFWATGKLTPGTRFWVAINNQPANPWNSTGTLPPPVVVPPNDLVLKTRTQELVQPFLGFARDQRFRDVVTAGVARQFDGDDNVLLSDVIANVEQAGVVSVASAPWLAFKAQVAAFQNIGGEAYFPQLYIPNRGDGAVPDAQITATIFESDLSRTAVPAYTLDASGNLVLKAGLVDEAYSEAHEVWVLSLNERVESGGVSSVTLKADYAQGPTDAQAAKGSPDVSTQALTCNSTGLRNNRGMEYLQRFRVPNPASVEHWISGKLEVRAIVVGKGGAEIKNANFGKIKRKTIKNGVSPELFLTTWDRAAWGDYLAYKWIEIDNGPKIELSLGLSLSILKLLKVDVAKVTATFESKNNDMGSGVVGFDELMSIEYGTGTVYWKTCGVGGDSGTNLARPATTSASSTFSGYSPSKINDGSRDTTTSGTASWANADQSAPGGVLPQWVQLNFGAPTSFSRVTLITSNGYPIRDYDLQVWNGSFWVTISSINGNTSLAVNHQFATQTAQLLRVYGRSGPTHQPQYVRVNELEVYS